MNFSPESGYTAHNDQIWQSWDGDIGTAYEPENAVFCARAGHQPLPVQSAAPWLSGVSDNQNLANHLEVKFAYGTD
jgi:hypothetical protein